MQVGVIDSSFQSLERNYVYGVLAYERHERLPESRLHIERTTGIWRFGVRAARAATRESIAHRTYYRKS